MTRVPASEPGSPPRGLWRLRGARGAVLVQTAVMMVGLTAFSAFVVDYGILWTARRQIQNAADAAALAAAISLGFDVPGDQALATQNALTAISENAVWGVAAGSDITFLNPCPTSAGGLPAGGECVRVEAHRNQQTPSTPLPTVFAQLANVTNQGVRATATARMLYGSSTDCVKPFAIPDRWQESTTAPWDDTDTFVAASGDAYFQPPDGYSRADSSFNYGYGAALQFTPAVPPLGPLTLPGNREFLPVIVTVGGSFDTDITSCSPRVISPGSVLDVTDNPAVPGATGPGVSALISADGSAVWDTAMNGGLGGVSGGCMSSGACTVSPRIIAVPAFNPALWGGVGGTFETVVVTRIVGFFIESYNAPYVVGRLMVYPVPASSTMTANPQSSFLVSVTLVR